MSEIEFSPDAETGGTTVHGGEGNFVVMQNYAPVPPKSLERALAFVKSGGRLCVRTVTRNTVIDAAVLAKFEKAGAWLLKEQGDGYRLRNGKRSVYLLPGQLEAINEGTAAAAFQ